MIGITWHLADDARTDLVVYLPEKESGAGKAWVSSLRKGGFHVHVAKAGGPDGHGHALRIPDELAAEVSGVTANPARYIISGYVPASSISRVLREHRSFDGLAVIGRDKAPSTDSLVPRQQVWGFWTDGHKELFELTSAPTVSLPDLPAEAGTSSRDKP